MDRGITRRPEGVTLSNETTARKTLDAAGRRDTLEALAEMLESQATLAGEDFVARAEALMELGNLYEDQLGELESAIDAY